MNSVKYPQKILAIPNECDAFCLQWVVGSTWAGLPCRTIIRWMFAAAECSLEGTMYEYLLGYLLSRVCIRY